VNRRIPLILLILFVFLLSGCESGRVLFWFEQPYWSTRGGSLVLQARLDAFALVHWKLPTFTVIPAGADPRAALTSALASGRYATVVVGPLLSLDFAAIAESHPRVRFILVGAPPERGALPPNVTALAFDRREAFREAGTIAALVAEGQSSAASSSRPLVGIVTSAASDLSAEEMAAFSEGVAATANAMKPTVRTLTGPADAASLQSVLAVMRKDGVQVFLLAVGASNPVALEALKSAGGSAVVADWAAARPDPRHVLLSVETDETAGIMSAIAAKGGSIVSGHVRVELGDAGPLPASARELLAAQR
jgi:basic membrane lipoprotein Med (substrate-binding protein (PBP1-ABC) superfamily)